MSDSAIHDAERSEWRLAVRGMSEVDRVVSCGHTYRNHAGVCVDCGEGIDL